VKYMICCLNPGCKLESPSCPDVNTTSPTNSTISSVTTSPSNNNNATAETYYQRGRELAGKDDKSAIDDYDRAIKLKPDSILSYARRGSAFSALGNEQKAINDLKRAIELKPDSSDAYRGRGDAKSDLGDNKGAIDDYTQAAKLYKKQGETKLSQAALDRVKELSK
jgi:tetratricopeptide (TPR) repeat protein